MKKFKITFAKIEPITGKNYYQIVFAYNAKQHHGNHVELFVEDLVVAVLYFASGVVSVEEQTPDL